MPDLTCPHCGSKLTKTDLDAARFDSHVVTVGECWEWVGAREPYGYGAFGANGKNYLTHRWQWERHAGPIPKGMAVLHKCDNPSCVRPDHLMLGTQGDNMRDKVAKGRHGYGRFQGEAHPRAKLTDEQVRAIRAASAAGVSYDRLASEYGLGKTTIGSIVRRRNWRHLD